MKLQILIFVHYFRIEEISNQLQIDNFADIISYWSMKRESRCGVPLIRRLQATNIFEIIFDF